MIELILTISIIGILMAWTTVYLSWYNEKRQVIEAQWCAATIWWELNNFIFYALTSKELNDTIKAPDYYRIWLDWWNSNPLDNTLTSLSFNDCTRDANYNGGYSWPADNLPILCENINLKYKNEDSEWNYKVLNASNTCKQYQSRIRFMRKVEGSSVGGAIGHGYPSNIAYININKWFTQWWLNDTRVFYMENADDTNKKPLIWNIIIVICLDSDCKSIKEIWKYDIDWRTQTISLNKCVFYEEDDSNKCMTRENDN